MAASECRPKRASIDRRGPACYDFGAQGVGLLKLVTAYPGAGFVRGSHRGLFSLCHGSLSEWQTRKDTADPSPSTALARFQCPLGTRAGS